MRRLVLLIVGAVFALAFAAAQSGSASSAATISIQPVGTYATGVPFNGQVGAAEIPAYDPGTRRVFVVNAEQQQIDVLDISSPSSPSLVGSIPIDGTPNSVAVSEGRLAVAVESDPKTAPGSVVIYLDGLRAIDV